MKQEATSEPFDPAAARAFMAALRAGLVALLEWLFGSFKSERDVPREIRLQTRQTLREARDDLFCLLVETYAHRLPPTAPKRRVHDHRPRRGVRSAVRAHRPAIGLKRILKRTLPKLRGSLRQRFGAVFCILRRFERMLLRFRAMLAKNYTSAWIVADVAMPFMPGRCGVPVICDSS